MAPSTISEGGRTSWKRFAPGITPWPAAFERGDDERALEIFATAVLGRHDHARLTEAMRQEARDNVAALKAQLLAGLPSFREQDARRATWGCRCVTGERCAPVHHRVTDRLEGLMRQAERVDLRDVSHLMFRDDPDAFTRAVLAFLARHDVEKTPDAPRVRTAGASQDRR